VLVLGTLGGIDGAIPQLVFFGQTRGELAQFLLNQFDLPPAALYRVNGPVNLVRLQQLISLVDAPELLFAPYSASYPVQLKRGESVFERLKRGDVLTHLPFESSDGVIDFLREAVHDPAVLAIKQTIYRTGNDSRMMDLLIDAQRRGKEVTAVVELKARFDEEANINWAERLEQAGGKISAVHAGGERFEADAFVCALGSFSRPALAALGLDLPVYPVKGYSLTVPVVNDAAAPVSTIIDETYKVAITRFDERIRVGGMAELSGYQIQLNPKRRETLELVLNDLYPHGGDTAQAAFWSGLRPMTPDSTPIVGATRFDNLFLNTGHGTLGWTMSLGSGKLAADLASGTATEIRSDDLGLSRYSGAHAHA